MSEDHSTAMRATLDAVYRAESRRVFATLVRLLGDFDTAEFTPQHSGCLLALMHEELPADRAMRVEARWTGMLYGLGVVMAQHDTEG